MHPTLRGVATLSKVQKLSFKSSGQCVALYRTVANDGQGKVEGRKSEASGRSSYKKKPIESQDLKGRSSNGDDSGSHNGSKKEDLEHRWDTRSGSHPYKDVDRGQESRINKIGKKKDSSSYGIGNGDKNSRQVDSSKMDEMEGEKDRLKVGSISIAKLNKGIAFGSPLARRLATPTPAEQERQDREESGSGLLSTPGTINTRPTLGRSIPDQFSTLFKPLYHGPSSLQSQTDWSMTDDIPSHIQHVKDSLEKSKTTRSKQPFVAIVIDGDQLFFLPEFLRMGNKGAEEALKLIQKHVNRDLQRLKINLTLEDIRIDIFCNWRGLSGMLPRGKVCTLTQLLEFSDGFVASTPFNLLVNSGQVAQAADIKVKAFLAEYIFEPNCLQIYLGGLGDHGYKSELDAIRTLGKLNQVQLLSLPEYTRQSRFYQEYLNRTVEWGSQVFINSSDLMERPDNELLPRDAYKKQLSEKEKDKRIL